MVKKNDWIQKKENTRKKNKISEIFEGKLDDEFIVKDENTEEKKEKTFDELKNEVSLIIPEKNSLINVVSKTNIKCDYFKMFFVNKVYEVDSENPIIKKYINLDLIKRTSNDAQITWDQVKENGYKAMVKYFNKQRAISRANIERNGKNKSDIEILKKLNDEKYDEEINKLKEI